MYHYTISLTILLFSLSLSVIAGGEDEKNNINWHNRTFIPKKFSGISTERAYFELLKDKQSKKIIVAVIDSGTDIEHEDLQGKIWTNPNEIPDNGIDDDKNGYVDDIHGWNFIGNKSGENVFYENLEITRIVRSEDKIYADYSKAKDLYDKELIKRKKKQEGYNKFKTHLERCKLLIKQETNISINSLVDLKKVSSSNPEVIKAKNFLSNRYAQGYDEEKFRKTLSDANTYLDYYLNLDFNARELVGDDPFNIEDRFYGNNDVIGTRADHGTTIAGVIAAIRNNEIGINGIAEDVKIMTLKSTPKGDERDKDVALSIIYAVDNGADIINMSFSKDLSPQKEFVDKAVDYAEKNGVLLIHCAGNKGQDLDIQNRYPNDRYLNNKEATNWLNVGATQINLDTEIIGRFSNYGLKNVDIYAPGVNIISLDSSNTYKATTGTSIATPIVTGIAALILTYYPDLTPQELISILMESSYKVTKPRKVLVPNLASKERDKDKFSNLSKSGGIINAYNAFKYIEGISQTK